MNVAATAGSSCSDRPYASEVRFGVVLYGGVSLAIYINGVTNELYEMACATPKAGATAPADGSTRGVYWKASWLKGSEALRRSYAVYLKNPQANPDPFENPDSLDSAERTRFVVDVISGTSAGGINGAFLAKALVNGQEFSPLKNLWIEEGDIDSLLNDDASYKGIAYAKDGSPTRSLLNSDRMYLKLLGAFEQMATAMQPIGESESPLVDEIDLYMTTTDIRGAVVPLRLFDEVVYEKRFKEVYHFQYSVAEKLNHLRDTYAPFLAFAARCTSSFPFAFEPMTVADAERLCHARTGGGAIDFDEWKGFFTGLSSDDMAKDRWRSRAFGDGGYLDNKPFSYVADALTWRLGVLPMERKLIYVEPAPDHPENERQVFADKPDALQNAFAALNTIPQYETIREDLEAILARNRRIERVERIVRLVEADIEARKVDPFKRLKLIDGKVPVWSTLDMSAMIDYYGVAFLPYRHLRMTTVTDDIADRLAVWWDIDRHTDRFYALRALARVWREARYYENKPEEKTPKENEPKENEPKDNEPETTAGRPPEKETINKFLDDFDVKYRLRRVGFLLRKVHQLRGLAIHLKQGKDRNSLPDIEQKLLKRLDSREIFLSSTDLEAFIKALNCLADGFGQGLKQLRGTVWMKAPADPDAAQSRATWRGTLDRVLGLVLGEQLKPPLERLYTSEGLAVEIKILDLPPLNPQLTLQENVFARARILFSLAAGAPQTQIQKLLEHDLETLRKGYAKVIGRSSDLDRKVPPVRALLGNPRLDPVEDATTPGKTQPEAATTDSKDQPKAVATDTESLPKAATTEGKGEPKVATPDSEIPRVVNLEVDDTVSFYSGALNTPAGTALRKFLAEYYLRFDEYDQMSFPLYYDTGTGEPSTVEVVRVSPEDARGLIDERNDKGDAGRQRRKLAGTAVFNFGAFLDVRWRRNDIMWGRLDGCERLLATLFPATVDKDVQAIHQALLQEAQRTILREEMQPEGYALLVDKFAAELANQNEASLKQAFDKLWENLAPADDVQRKARVALALKAVLGDAGLVDYVRRYYEVDRDLDTPTTLKTGARALTITGRILQESEKRYRAEGRRMVWVTRGGRALQVLLAISTPGGLSHAAFRHWLGMLYLFEVLIVVGATAFSAPATQTFGFTCLAITAVLHAASLLAGDIMYRRWWWLVLFGSVVAVGVVLLAALGVLAWSNVGLTAIVCVDGNDGGLLLWALCELVTFVRSICHT